MNIFEANIGLNTIFPLLLMITEHQNSQSSYSYPPQRVGGPKLFLF